MSFAIGSLQHPCIASRRSAPAQRSSPKVRSCLWGRRGKQGCTHRAARHTMLRPPSSTEHILTTRSAQQPRRSPQTQADIHGICNMASVVKSRALPCQREQESRSIGWILIPLLCAEQRLMG